MSGGRRPDGSYGPEYGPLPPELEYAFYRQLSSRGGIPWALNQHGDYSGRLMEQRFRRELYGFSRNPLQPFATFRTPHVGRDGATINPRPRQESSDLTEDEFREAMGRLRMQEYRPSNPQNRRGGSRGIIQNRSARAEASPAVTEEEKACTICLEAFLQGEQVVITPCNHMFHQGCITPWVKGHGNCPLCRSALCEKRGTSTGNINSSNGDGDVDLDLMAMMTAMEEAFSQVRLSDLMSYYH